MSPKKRKKCPKYLQKNANISVLLIVNCSWPPEKKKSHLTWLCLETTPHEKVAVYAVIPYETVNSEREKMDVLDSLSEVVCTEFRKYWCIDLLILSMEIYEYWLGFQTGVAFRGYKIRENVVSALKKSSLWSDPTTS